ncbi:twin-arginine translocase TatA/TatE family subunit [Chlamydiia bacterium]|jgi:sec-independent protein translocase protein TatA|nr:twin-arginine translocase TatA/TatE family subunit [Chlamydiia bacterium]
MLGKAEIIVILIVVLIVFGANKLPEFARNLGSAFKEFKKSVRDDDTNN